MVEFGQVTRTLHSILQHGYWVVFLIVMLESAGVPLPGETVLMLASGYAGATGELDLALVITFAATAAIIVDNIGFRVGRTWGAKFLLRYGKSVRVPGSRLKLGQYLFEKHSAKIVFFGRFVAFLRVFAALLAGVNKYRWPQFLFFNAAGDHLGDCDRAPFSSAIPFAGSAVRLESSRLPVSSPG